MENKEKYNQIIGDAYKNYRLKSKDIDLPENLYNNLINDLNKDAMFPIDNPSRVLTQEEFINKCKTDDEFSEKWGLKIEERELSLEERKRIYEMEYTNDIEVENNHWLESKLKTRNIPTKQITLEYNNEKTYCYD